MRSHLHLLFRALHNKGITLPASKRSLLPAIWACIAVLVSANSPACAQTSNNGGGGGTFVVLQTGNVPLIIAGGGGGASGQCCGSQGNGAPGVTASAGTVGLYTTSVYGSGGSGGNGGTGGDASFSAGSGAGGGFLTNGGDAVNNAYPYRTYGGAGFLNGGSGGAGTLDCGGVQSVDGGFGGGGGAACYPGYYINGPGGGGGGYSGGAGTNGGSQWGAGGGGGSYNSGSAQANHDGSDATFGNAGDGSVLISWTGGSQTFGKIHNTLQSFTVPAGITAINIVARGAQGGNADAITGLFGKYYGGNGAYMSGAFTVSPGNVLTILVGETPESYTGGTCGVPFITTGAVNSSYCPGSSVSVPYTAAGTFNSGNVFTAQLSNGSGSFASPVSIGSATGVSSGSISAAIPANAVAGTGYRIRVIGSSPATTGSDNGSDFSIHALPSASISGNNSPVCTGSNATFTLSGTSNATVTYSINSGASTTTVLTGGTANVTVSGATANQILSLVSVSDGSCGQSLAGTSTVTVNKPDIDISGGSPLTSIADGDLVPGSADGTAFGTGVFSRTFTVKNTGPCPLNISVVSSNTSEFSISGAPALVPAQSGITPGQATFTVNFTPTATGSRTATITVSNNTAGHPAYAFGVSGTGVAGAALDFDGSDDIVTLGNESNFDFTNQMTVEAWVKIDPATSSYARIVDKYEYNSQTGYILFRDPLIGGVGFYINGNGGPGAYSPVSISDNLWHHVAGTFDNGIFSVYVDGVLKSRVTTAAMIATNNKAVTIGNGFDQVNNYPLKGGIDEVRIWNKVRTCDEIGYYRNCELTGSESGLVGYYKFNQGIVGAGNSGITTLTDATANGNNGALTGFALAGTASNWIAPGGVTTGSTCTGIVVAPEINVRGNSISIADGAATPLSANYTHFGSGVSSRTFTVQNTGNGAMSVSGVSITGVNAGDFSVIAQPATSVGSNGSTNFTIGFNQSASGLRKAVVHVSSNDCDEADYDFAISGMSTKRYYVDLAATGANDGTTWPNAFTSFQSALNIAAAGDSVLTAQGTYKPSTGIQPSPTPRTNTFALADGASYFGGFPTGGGSFASRNFSTQRSILSGDIGAANVNTDNCFMVVNAINLTANTILNGFTIENGRADSAGYTIYSRASAISLGTTGAMQFESLTIRNNTGNTAVSGDGPAAWSVANCTFENNGTYGALYIGGNASGAFTNCAFTNNTGYNGGAISENVNTATFSFTGCSFTGNVGTYGGGGGAINAGNAANTFTNCSFANNSSVGAGGALNKFYATANTFSYCTFTGNSGYGGGALYGQGGFNIDHCVFSQNYATGSPSTYSSHGGAIYNNGTPSTISNTVFRANATLYGAGGAIYNNTGGTMNLTNCTFTLNNAGGYGSGGALNNNSTSNANVSNCIFWGNTANGSHANADAEIIKYTGTLNVSNTIWQGNTSGGTIYNADPLFTNAAAGDLTLQDCSPAIDSGAANALITDIAGNARPVDVFPGGLSTDIGAYERQTAPLSREINLRGNGVDIADGAVTPSSANHTHFGSGISSRTFTIQNIAGGGPLSISGITITGTNASDFSLTSAPAGSVAANGTTTFTIGFNQNTGGIRKAVVHIANSDCDEGDYDFAISGANIKRYYVDLSATGTNDGTTWANAFTDFQSALSIAAAGDTVLTAKGTYKPSISISPSPTPRTRTFTLANGVAYYGGFPAGGGAFPTRNFSASRTTLSGDIGTLNDSTDNCFLVVNAQNLSSTTLMSGFTVERGNGDSVDNNYPLVLYKQAGGINLGMSGVMRLDSVTVRNCFGRNGAGGVEGLGNHAITMRGCGFYNNNPRAISIQYGGGQVFLNDTFANNGASGAIFINDAATFNGCVFTGNRSTSYGGVMSGGGGSTFTDCSFSNNSAGIQGGVLYSFYGVHTFTRCTFNQNSANSDGGCIFIPGFTGGADFDRCRFTGNSSATGDGGAIYIANRSADIKNCVFWNNSATLRTSGAVYNNGGTMAFTNCSFAKNACGSSQGGALYNNFGVATISNCIFWGNVAAGNDAVPASEIGVGGSGAAANVTNTIWQGNNTGGTIYNSDPLFTNAATGDLTLQDCSPAIDSGAANALITDIAGNTRPVDVFPGGLSTDIGAYERQTAPVIPEINVLGNSLGITDGSASPSLSNHSDFGTGTVSHTFTIQNTGTAALSVTGVSVTGANAADFTVTASPAASVAIGAATSFTVLFSPSAVGLRTATMHVNNNDCNEGDYDFAIKGMAEAGAALNFDGADDNVTVSYDLNKSALTLEAWVRPTSSARMYAICNDNPNNYGAGFGLNNYSLEIDCHNTFISVPGTPFSNGVWAHVSVVYNPDGTVRAYVNGNEVYNAVPNTSWTASMNGTPYFYIGRHNANSALTWDGDMDEVRVWSRSLCQTEIVNNMSGSLPGPASQPGLAAYYKMNQGVASGNNTATGANVSSLTDASASALSGTLSNFARSGNASNFVASTVGTSAAPVYAGPATPTISASATTSCAGNTVTLSIASGSLNNAAGWQWYSGSCGGTPVGSGTSINVAPTATTTYYARGEGCVAPGACGAITITINPKPVAGTSPVSQTICSGALTTAIAHTGSPAGTTFSWTRTGAAEVTGIPASGSGDIGAAALTNTTGSAVTVTFTITPSLTTGGATCAGTPVTATVLVDAPVVATAAVTPLYTMANQQIQTIYKGYPSAAQSETISVSASGGSGTGTYGYAWTMSGCNTTALITGFSASGSTHSFNPSAAGAPALCAANNGNNVFIFNIAVTDAYGCAALPLTKKINVVNPYGANPATQVAVCHKTVIVGGGTSGTPLIVTPAQANMHLAHGDVLGNCAPFTGRDGGVAAAQQSGEEGAFMVVYPNPSTGIFTIELSSIEAGADVLITDVQGKAVALKRMEKDGAIKTQFDLSALARGMYLIEVRDGGRMYRSKIVMQ